MHRLLAAALLALLAAPVAAAPADDLHALIQEHWRWYLAENPVSASGWGYKGYEGRLDDPSLVAQDRAAGQAAAFLRRLAALPDAALGPADRTNKAVLSRLLAEQVEANRYPERARLLTSYASWFQNFAAMADTLPFADRADYESYLQRLEGWPAYDQAAIATTRAGIRDGVTQPCVSLGGVDRSIAGLIADRPETTRYWRPFAGARPAAIDAADWAALKSRALRVIATVVVPENRRLLAFYRQDYLPHCRQAVGAATLPQGADWYAFRVRAETTTDLTPAEIHAIGLREVARIGAEMDALARRAGYPTRAAFVAKLRTDPVYYARTPAELLGAAALQAKTIDGLLPGFFRTLPRLPYGIRAIPAETAEGTTTAYYQGGSADAGVAGTFYVNTSKLDGRPLWELPALTAHEAVPGHHNQIARAQELPLPDVRRYAAGFTAYVEGWALYSERLGIEMGLYDTPEKEMGRLSYEMWRACRLVVDTGLHAEGWDKPRAVAFMRANTALSDANIDAEVNRYISWPGQALAYKLGELRIRALRAEAEQALGPRFDLKGFHEAVLGQGPVPLDTLSANVRAWIAAERGH